MAGVAGFEPTHGGVKVRCLFPQTAVQFGDPEFEDSAPALRAYAAVRQQPLTPRAKLGWLDSNQRMAESKSAALPLGYTPSRFSFADGTANGKPDYRLRDQAPLDGEERSTR